MWSRVANVSGYTLKLAVILAALKEKLGGNG